MPNKIASIILNSAKTEGLSDVFVAQPDSLTENMAGKFFLLASINGKKNDSRKIFDFLVKTFENNYYNDEKLALCGKIEGLKVDNIFEAAVTKTNNDLQEFIVSEKLLIDFSSTNLTLGAICDNKLYFSNFGSNRALLIFNRGQKYEVINVEANATELVKAESGDNDLNKAPIKARQLFSSVINGEIPDGAYFIFANEALPEYLSTREMIEIVTKLAPIVASEQIKNVLAKINNYVPFLGVLIKNTTNLVALEIKDEKKEERIMSRANSSLNYTEERTERVLAPAGLISLSKIKNIFGILKRSLFPANNRVNQTHQAYSKTHPLRMDEQLNTPKVNIGEIKSLKLARSDSFLVKEKIFFKKKNNFLFTFFKKIPNLFWQFLDPRAWQELYRKNISWLKSLNRRSRWLFIGLVAILPIFIGSILLTNWRHQLKIEQENTDRSLKAVTSKLSEMNISFLYNNQEAANKSLGEARDLLSAIVRPDGGRAETYDQLQNELKTAEEKVNKIVRLNTATKLASVDGLQVVNLALAGEKIYVAGGTSVYEFSITGASSTKIDITGATELSAPFFDDKNDRLYYRSGQQLAQLNLKTGTSNLINVNNLKTPVELQAFEIFNASLYALSGQDGKIYKYRRSADSFTGQSLWLTEELDLSGGQDMFIDGDIYVLQTGGQIFKLFKGKRVDYNLTPIAPAISGTTKISARGNNLYILDAPTKRLIVFDKKTGGLIKQYVLEFTGELLDFVLNDTNNSVYILDKQALYQITLD